MEVNAVRWEIRQGGLVEYKMSTHQDNKRKIKEKHERQGIINNVD